MANVLKTLKDLVGGLNNSVIGNTRYTGGKSGYTYNGMYDIEARGGAKVTNKLFNQLMQFDNTTSKRIQPFVGGRFVLVIGDMPPMMEVLHPNASEYMRVLFTSTVISVNGFADHELATETVQALTEQNSYDIVTKATGATRSITITFMTIFQGLPIYRYITKWMNYIQNRGSGVSSYPHLTAAANGDGNALEYHEGNHSMTAVYMVTDPAMRFVEDGAFLYSMVPTNNQGSQILDQEWGSSSPKTLAIPFKVQVITSSQHDGVADVLTQTLARWTQYIALDDNQVILDNILANTNSI